MKNFILNFSILLCFAFGLIGAQCPPREEQTVDKPLTDVVVGEGFDFTNFNFFKYSLATAEDGKVYHINNPLDPSTFVECNTGTNVIINAVCDDNDPFLTQHLFACNAGVGLISSDEGLNCFQLNTGTTKNLYACSFTDDIAKMAFVGEDGFCCYSSDFGGTFQEVVTGVTIDLTDIYQVNSGVTLCCGNEATLIKSTTYGETWEPPIILPTGADFNCLGSMGTEQTTDGIDVNIVGVVGDSGKCFKSTDYETWTPVETGTTEDLYDINFRNSQEGYVAGANGLIRYTIDGGLTWYTVDTSPSVGVFTDTIRASATINDTAVTGVAGKTIYVLHEEESVLPVELSAFTYTNQNNDVLLYWTTASESNNSGFEIERRDARRETQDAWKMIGFVNGYGTTTSPNTYEFEDRGLNSGKYNYRLKQIDYNGNFEYYNLTGEVVIGVPDKFMLSQNYPNPFNPTTNLEFGISNLEFVSLKVYDVSGKEVAVLVNENLNPGIYEYEWNASEFTSGVYFYKLEAGIFTETKKMILTK